MLRKTTVVVFDFDGTLSARDSNVEFARYCFKHSIRPWLYLPLMMVCGVLRWIRPHGLWWRENIRRFLTRDMVKKYAPDFIRQHKRERFGWAKERVQYERDCGHKVVLISASTDYLVPQLVRDMKFDAVITSQMNKEKPWKYERICWGVKKVYALDEWAKQNKIIPDVVRSYSDSKSDMPLMEIADEQVWINRKTGMRK
ncbi:MAG: HAD-IB family phosphatase [Alphaproteobacteria bacterium]|nr:HAD-IB family phosphatase [Alphaproteobacteria bacterium]